MGFGFQIIHFYYLLFSFSSKLFRQMDFTPDVQENMNYGLQILIWKLKLKVQRRSEFIFSSAFEHFALCSYYAFPVAQFSLSIHLMSLHILLAYFLIMCFLQVELGFGNGVVDDVFFVPGYSISGFVVAQVIFVGETYFIWSFTSFFELYYSSVKRSIYIYDI